MASIADEVKLDVIGWWLSNETPRMQLAQNCDLARSRAILVQDSWQGRIVDTYRSSAHVG